MKLMFFFLVLIELLLLLVTFLLTVIPSPWRRRFVERKVINYGVCVALLIITSLFLVVY